METLVLILFLVVVVTYLFVGYKLYLRRHTVAVWELLLVILVPFWGCLAYLLLENYRWKKNRKGTSRVSDLPLQNRTRLK